MATQLQTILEVIFFGLPLLPMLPLDRVLQIGEKNVQVDEVGICFLVKKKGCYLLLVEQISFRKTLQKAEAY